MNVLELVFYVVIQILKNVPIRFCHIKGISPSSLRTSYIRFISVNHPSEDLVMAFATHSDFPVIEKPVIKRIKCLFGRSCRIRFLPAIFIIFPDYAGKPVGRYNSICRFLVIIHLGYKTAKAQNVVREFPFFRIRTKTSWFYTLSSGIPIVRSHKNPCLDGLVTGHSVKKSDIYRNKFSFLDSP